MVSIIYCNWNTLSHIIKSIECIERFPPRISYEIIISDNGSNDGIDEWIKEHPKYIFLKNKYNMGYGHAANKGILESKGKYIALLNPDTFPQEGWLDKLTDFLDSFPEVSLVGPSSENVCCLWQDRNRNQGGSIEVHEVIPFVCVVIRKSAFWELGLLSLRVEEDLEFARRLVSAGKKLVVVGSAFVGHTGHSSLIENKVGTNQASVVRYNEEVVKPRLWGE